MMRHLLGGALCAMLAVALPAGAGELRTNTLYRSGSVTKNVGYANLVVHDVRGDSRPEIISCTNGFAFAMSYNGTRYRDSWYSPWIGCTAVAAGDHDGNGTNEVIVGTGTSSYGASAPSYIYIFDATSYGPEVAKVQVSATDSIRDIAIGKVDGDPGLEIVALTANNVYVYNASTLALKWTAPYGGYHVGIGDLEGDGQNEIIVAGADGHVLNGYTHTYKWGYVGGFGSSMVVADVDNDGKAEIVGGGYSSVTIVNGDTMTSTTLPLHAQSLAVGDVNNDGLNELVVGPDQWGYVEGYTATGTKLWSINNPEHGVQGMTVGDPDGDGKNQVIWGAGATSSGSDTLLIGDAATQKVVYRAVDLDGVFLVAVGDLNGDGRPEMVVASGTTESGYQGGTAWVLDYATGRLLATLAVPPDFAISRVAIGQVDGDAAKEIILLGYVWYSGAYAHVFDGATYAKEWSSPAANISSTGGLVVRDVDGDGIDEIIYGTTDYKVQVLNGATPVIKWTSPSLGGPIYDIKSADLEGNGVQQLVVAASNGTYVFKTSDWSQRTQIAGAPRHVAATQGHFAVTLYNGGITEYSGTSLAQEWSCTANTTASDLAFVTLAGQQRLAASMNDTTIRFYPLGGATCPAYDTISRPADYPSDSLISFTDVDGDGRPELLLGTNADLSVTALAWSSEARGDADTDGIITDADIDALAAHFYGDHPAAPPTADVNADGAVRPDDLFYLINYRRGTGAAPPP